MKNKKDHGKKAQTDPSDEASGKDSTGMETKTGSASGKSGNAHAGKEPPFDDLDEMRKDIDALGEILGADGRSVPPVP